MSKAFLWAVAGLVVGVLVGLWQPQREMQRMREEVRENDREVAALRRRSAAQGIAGLFHPSGPAKSEAAPPAPSEVGPGEEAVAVAEVPAAGTSGSMETAPEVGPKDPLADANSMAAVQEGLDARAAQARAALIEQADPTDEELAAFDAAIDRMNERLQGQVEGLAAQIRAGGEPSRRDLMELGAEGLDAMIEADDAISAVFPDDVRESLDDELLDPFSHLDGSTLASLSDLDDLSD
jgi:hypothetical protein